MSGPSFDHTISLGRKCSVAYNLRRRFSTSTAYPFDWWEMGYGTLTRLLDDNFAALFAPETLALDPETGCVCSTHYGLKHWHDFAQDGERRALPGFEAQLPFLKEKFAALIARMDRTMNSGRVLAVRDGLYAEGETPDLPAPEIATRAAALLERLRARWPAGSVELLVVNPSPTPLPDLTPPDPGIRYAWVAEEPGDDIWQAAAWDRMFDNQAITLRRKTLNLVG
jgi:hypothetical protein